MIDTTKPIHRRHDGTYVATVNGYPYHVVKDDPLFADVESYLAEHPEAIVPEPIPSPPSPAELLKIEEAGLLSRLAATDWYVTRFAETGDPIPEAISAERSAARERISEIRFELSELAKVEK